MLMHKFDFISYIRDFQLMRIQLTNFSPAVHNARNPLGFNRRDLAKRLCTPTSSTARSYRLSRRQIEAVRYYRDYIDSQRYSSDALRFVH